MPIIAISRGSLSGGKTLAEKLGNRLGSKVISREAIIDAAKEQGVSEATLVEAMQSPPGLWDRVTHQKEDYILAVQAALAELIAHGSAIYHGNAGQLLLREVPGVIKVRLIAPLDYRIRAAMAERGIGRDEAARYIESADTQRQRWVRQMYGVEWNDSSLYDLVVNLEHIDMESAVDLVADLAARPQYVETPERLADLQDFVVATRVRAALAFRSGLGERSLSVSVRRGVARLQGGAHFERNRAAIVDLVRSVPGVTTIAGEAQVPAAKAVAAITEKSAGELMIPIAGYPHVSESVTIRETMAALAASTVKLADGHLIPPRYVLVLDQSGRLTGLVTRRDLLRGLTPQAHSTNRTHDLVRAFIPAADLSYPLGFKWLQFFGSAAIACADEPVKAVMVPVRGSVQRTDDASVVIGTMLEHGIDLVPVLDGAAVVGVVLMTDVFDAVAEHVLERRGQST